jgi:hypothetical protein
MTEPAAHELLSALLDREPVDPDRLSVLLEDAEARAMLIDFVRVRFVLHGDSDQAVPAPPLVLPRRPRHAGTVVLRIAAALVLLALGALAGRRFVPSDVDAPPEPTRVVQLSSGEGAR